MTELNRSRFGQVLLGIGACLVLTCPLARANPVGDPSRGTYEFIEKLFLVLAIAAEVAVVAVLLMVIFKVRQRVGLVVAISVLNVASYGIFILGAYPIVEQILAIEVLIWLTEAIAIRGLIGLLESGRMIRTSQIFPVALAVSLWGNLTSYFIGALV